MIVWSIFHNKCLFLLNCPCELSVTLKAALSIRTTLSITETIISPIRVIFIIRKIFLNFSVYDCIMSSFIWNSASKVLVLIKFCEKDFKSTPIRLSLNHQMLKLQWSFSASLHTFILNYCTRLFYFAQYLWEWTAEMVQYSPLRQPAIRATSSFIFDDLVTWYLQNYRFYLISATAVSLFYRL